MDDDGNYRYLFCINRWEEPENIDVIFDVCASRDGKVKGLVIDMIC